MYPRKLQYLRMTPEIWRAHRSELSVMPVMNCPDTRNLRNIFFKRTDILYLLEFFSGKYLHPVLFGMIRPVIFRKIPRAALQIKFLLPVKQIFPPGFYSFR